MTHPMVSPSANKNARMALDSPSYRGNLVHPTESASISDTGCNRSSTSPLPNLEDFEARNDVRKLYSSLFVPWALYGW